MPPFLKNIFSSLIGTLVALILFAFIFIGILIAALGSEDAPEIKPKSVVLLEFDKPIVEKEDNNPLKKLDLPFEEFQMNLGLVEMLKVIDAAEKDPNVSGLFLNLTSLAGGYAQVEDIRNALATFKESGKKVWAYGEVMTEKAYYLASVADEVYLPPSGMLEFKGLSAEIMFYKNLLERLELEPKIFRVGKFKSAVEPFMLEQMSEENRLQVQSFLESIYQHNLQQIAESRSVSYDALREMSDSLKVKNVEEAVKLGLIDEAAYLDQVMDTMKAALELAEGRDIAFMKFQDYYDAKFAVEELLTPGTNQVAYIVASGEIMSGTSNQGFMGSRTMVKALRKARKNDNVKAVVLRINSPGGSALASDVMWREIQLLSAEKPVIASMSSVAASGGYYMAMGCDTIVAQPNTITGSIGVFGLLVNAEGFLKNKLGVTTDRVKTGPYADLGNPTREMTIADSVAIQTEVNRIYEEFTTKAAEGRGMEVDALKEVASGRVWTGAQAKEVGLVDVLGGSEEALAIAAEAAGLTDYDVVYYPKSKGLFGEVEDTHMQLKEEVLKRELGEFYEVYKGLPSLEDLRGVKARMPFDLELK